MAGGVRPPAAAGTGSQDADARSRQPKVRTGMSAVITATGLSKHYKSTLALDKVSFLIEPGRIVGLIGPNGAGRTRTRAPTARDGSGTKVMCSSETIITVAPSIDGLPWSM